MWYWLIEKCRYSDFSPAVSPLCNKSRKGTRHVKRTGASLFRKDSAFTQRDPVAIVPQLRGIVQSLDPNLPLDQVMTMEQRVSASVAHPRFFALLLASFAALAVVLAAIGLYGVISFGVRHCTREIGIRMALGADSRDILRLVLGQGTMLIAAGLVIGVGGAVAASRALRGMLFGVAPGDVWVYAAVTTVLAAVGLAACYVPARRATHVRPAEALRYD
jgi:putative ABC transport system permease protein